MSDSRYLHKIEVLEAKYDKEEEILVISSVFHDLEGARRLIVINKQSTGLANPELATDEYMEKTAHILNNLKGKVLNWEMRDDPSHKSLSQEDMNELYSNLVKGVDDTMQEVVNELDDPQKQIDRKLASVMRKEKDMDNMIRNFMD